ncbi:MAG: hypothetical protein ACFFCE_16890 [Promethearchaeota archaeon]
MTKIEIRCPICEKWKDVEIADDAPINVPKGVLAINIEGGDICEHSFIVYIDKNFDVRNCLVADFEVEIQEDISNRETKTESHPETETLKLDLIRLNLPEILIAYIIRAIFLGKRIVVISDQEFLFAQFNDFFQYIFKKSFEFEMDFISEEEYNKKKNQYEEFIVFKKSEIIRDKNKIINPKKIEIEKAIVHKFISEYDLMSGLIIMKNEINKIYEFSKHIADYIKKNEGETITTKMLINHMLDFYNEKIQVSYLSLLIEVVYNYFKINISEIDGLSKLL